MTYIYSYMKCCFFFRLEGMRPKRSPRVSGGESTDSESDEALTEDAKSMCFTL